MDETLMLAEVEPGLQEKWRALTAELARNATPTMKEVTDLDYETVAADLARRDALDQGRDVSPLVEADGAFLVDTTGLSVDDIIGIISREIDG